MSFLPTARSVRAAWILLLVCLLVNACSSTPSIQEQIAPTTDTRRAVAALALEQLGAPYRAEAAGPEAFDDSGLTYFAYRGAGTQLPRSTQAQLEAGKPIDLAEAQPADLIFFRVETTDGGDRLLVGLYTQPGEMLMARPGASKDASVRLLDLDDSYWKQRMVGVVRLLP